VPRRDQTAAAVASATAPHRNRTGSEPADRQVREVESRVLHHLDQQQAVLPHRHAVDLAHLLGGNGRDRRRPKLEEPMPRPSASLVHDLMVPHRVSGEARYPDSKCLLDAIDRASRWVSGILNPRGRARSAQGRFVNGQVAGDQSFCALTLRVAFQQAIKQAVHLHLPASVHVREGDRSIDGPLTVRQRPLGQGSTAINPLATVSSGRS
jgi:hypothetical protein